MADNATWPRQLVGYGPPHDQIYVLALHTMNILILIPARGGSKRLPGKHLRHLAGRSLMEWTARDISASGLDAPCLLTTDDEAIAEAGRKLGWMVPFLRPPELATDQAPTIEAALHATDWYERNCAEPDAVMLLQVTSPLRGPDCLNKAVEMLQARPDADAVVAMRELPVSIAHAYAQTQDGFLHALGSGDGNNKVLAPNGAVYLVRKQAMRDRHSLFPPRTLPLVMDATASVDIDTQEDWDQAEAVLSRDGIQMAQTTTGR